MIVLLRKIYYSYNINFLDFKALRMAFNFCLPTEHTINKQFSSDWFTTSLSQITFTPYVGGIKRECCGNVDLA